MSKRYWFISVGPLDDDGARNLAEEIRSRLAPPLDATLMHYRTSYSRDLDEASVRDALQVLRAGLLDESLSLEVRHSVMGLVSDMEHWLERELASYEDTEDAT